MMSGNIFSEQFIFRLILSYCIMVQEYKFDTQYEIKCKNSFLNQ